MSGQGSVARFLGGFLLLLALFATSLPAGASSGGVSPDGTATITFRKVFKTSYPEFVEITVNRAGSGTYDIRGLDEEPSPQPLEISASLAQRVFDLAARLHNFQGIDLAVHRRIANLGEKTFRYQKSGEVHEVSFNYTLDDSATQLLNIFEGLTRQEMDLSNLQRVMRYDRLGVNDALAQLETDYNNKLLPEPEKLLATLDQIGADEKFLEIARQRARALAGKIRSSH